MLLSLSSVAEAEAMLGVFSHVTKDKSNDDKLPSLTERTTHDDDVG
jgi:hypothetical protein